jgi:addiction module HigA family antidote
MTNSEYASSGLPKGRNGKKLQITTKKPQKGVISMVRIPTNGPPTRPGEMLLEEFMKPIGMSQTELAEKMGVPYPRINELIHGKRGITPDTALRLEQLFGMEAQYTKGRSTQKARERAGLTKKELAHRLKTKKTSISRI